MREKLIELFKQEHERCQNTPCDECIYDNAADCGVDALVDYLIANDVVQVVRCKDCEHWHEETEWCDKHSHFVDRLGDFCYPEESGDWKMFDADYFCKDGERKDNE